MDADVVVVGAGAAGLAAARRLLREGARVVLLEARDRLGGRILSRAIEGFPSSCELGAEFIHGPAPETLALLRETGGAAVDTGGESWRVCDGKLVCENDDFLESAALFDRARLLAADQSVDAYLRRFESDAATFEAARAFVEGFEAADPAMASVRAIAQELASGVDSISARPLLGYAPIVARLHRDVVAGGGALVLRSTARVVAWKPGRVRIETTSGTGGHETLHAKAAVVTLPVGVLRDDGRQTVRFEPELPGRKRVALEHLEMGKAVKVVLWFDDPFWEKLQRGRLRNAAFFRSDGAFPAFWTQLPVRSRLIVAWAGGPKAHALRGLHADELIVRARDEFGRLIGEPGATREHFEGGAMHDWTLDPCACGAYSYVAVGGDDARMELAAPLDRTLFFAGEATSTDGQGGTVNGALETGERAAREFIAQG